MPKALIPIIIVVFLLICLLGAGCAAKIDGAHTTYQPLNARCYIKQYNTMDGWFIWDLKTHSDKICGDGFND